MRWQTAIIPTMVVTALLGAAWPAATSSLAAPGQAGNSAWTGTFQFHMQQTFAPDYGAGNSDTIIADCTATITRHANGTASATATYSRDETRIEGQQTSTYHIPSTTASMPQWGSPPTFGLDGQGGYIVYIQVPSVDVKQTVTVKAVGSTTTTQTYDTAGQCDPGGGEEGKGKLPGGTTVTGSKTASLLNGTTITLDWTIQDSTLQKGGIKPPTGKIKVTNNGIDATVSWLGWEFSYAGDWKATQAKPSAPPKITSPDQKVTVTVQVQPVAQAPTKAAVQSTITKAGQTAGGVKSITFKPFAIGNLTGQIGEITLANSPDTLLVVVVGDAQHQVIAQVLAKPSTPPVDLLQAGMAISTIQPAS